MRARRGGAVLVALALAAGASAPHQALAATAESRGREVAKAKCAACHAVPPVVRSPNPAAPGFGSLEMRHTAGLEGRLATLTRKGHYGMPPIKLRPQEVQDLLAYIESLAPR